MSRLRLACDFPDDPPRREWIVQDFVPHCAVTLVSGDGGIGKSRLLLQLAIARSLGDAFLGLPTRPGATVYLCAEDELGEIHRRLIALCNGFGRRHSELKDLFIKSIADCDDAALVRFNGRNEPTRTALWNELVEELRSAQPQPTLLIVDAAADVFGGDENSRGQVRHFIALLRSLALKFSVAVILVSHPSKLGKGLHATSGSSAWRNSVRSLVTLERKDGSLLLRVDKSNYGAHRRMNLEWHRGVYTPVPEAPDDAPASTSINQAQAHADAVFLEAFDRLTAMGQELGPLPSKAYAPAVIEKSGLANGCGRKGLHQAMVRAIERGVLRVEKAGPASRQKSVLRRAVAVSMNGSGPSIHPSNPH